MFTPFALPRRTLRQHDHAALSRRRLALEPLESRRLLSVDLVSAAYDGQSGGNGPSTGAHLSSDGRYVAFQSSASNLVSNGTNGTTAFFQRDLLLGTTRRVGDGFSGTSFSDDYRYAVRRSEWTFEVVDTSTGSVVAQVHPPLHIDSGPHPVGYFPLIGLGGASLSGDGRFLGWTASYKNTFYTSPTTFSLGWVTDLRTRTGKSIGGYDVSGLTLSEDGRYAAHRPQFASNFYVTDFVGGVTTLASSDSLGNAGNGYSDSPRISADGRFATFASSASNLVPDDTNGVPDVFVKDLTTGQTTRVSTNSSGGQANRDSFAGSFAPQISGDGRFVTFLSSADNLVPGDTNPHADLFVKDLASGAVARANVGGNGEQTNQHIMGPAISSDGRYIAFETAATNLHPLDASGVTDVYRVWNPLLPAEIQLFGSAITEHRPVGAIVGLFATGAVSAGPFSYSLAAGDGDADNGAFSVEGNQLKTAATFDFATRSSYSVRVRSTDGVGVTCENVFTINVTPSPFAFPGLYDPQTSIFHLRNSNTEGPPDNDFGYGMPRAGWKPVAGDWNGDGQASVGLYDPSLSWFYMRNTNDTGIADYAFGYGDPALSRSGRYVLMTGDWNGDGVETVGLYDRQSAQWYLRNSNTAGAADVSFGYGEPNSTWTPIVGDWNGDGLDTIGFYDTQKAIYYLRNTNTIGFADYTFGYGQPGSTWTPIMGDWDGDADATIGFYDQASSHWYLRNSNDQGIADVHFGFGDAGAGWLPVVGAWSGSGAQALVAVGSGEQSGVSSQALAPSPSPLAPQFAPLLSAALADWAAAGTTIATPQVVLADLPGATLGLAEGATIYLDVDAAGHGWFIDPTPAANEEFSQPDRNGQMAAIDARAVDHIDLLTVIEHELGHLAGLDDLTSADSLMSGRLPTGVRRSTG